MSLNNDSAHHSFRDAQGNKKNRMNFKEILSILAGILLFGICGKIILRVIDFPNDMYINNQHIISTYPKGIVNLFLAGAERMCHLSWKSEEDAPQKINLNQLPSGYEIEVTFEKGDWHRKKIQNTSLKLKPNSFYSIDRSQGDRESFGLDFWTDSMGQIYKSQPIIHTHSINSLPNATNNSTQKSKTKQ